MQRKVEFLEPSEEDVSEDGSDGPRGPTLLDNPNMLGCPTSNDTVATSNADETPQWYSDLAEEHISAFREVFELLDSDGGGSIDAGELYCCLKDLDLGITKEEIETVLRELDKDGNGEIDFDEFLYAMTETERVLDGVSDGEDKAEDEEGYSRRQTLFFSAITKFAIKNSLGTVERYYKSKSRQMPHVLHHYTAGARLIGLTDRQLARHLKQMQADNKGNKSPYAKPLQFVISSPNSKAKKKNKHSRASSRSGSKSDTPTSLARHAVGGPSPMPPVPKVTPVTRVMSEPATDRDSVISLDVAAIAYLKTRRRTAITSESPEVKKILATLGTWAEKGSIVAKLPGAHLVPEVRKKLEDAGLNEDTVLCSSKRKQKQMKQRRLSIAGKSEKRKPKPRGWIIPRIDRGQVPLPLIKVTKQFKGFTIEDVPKIRETVSTVVEDYYSQLRQNKVQTAFDHWENLHTDKIPQDLRNSFKRVYRAYSPHAEKEVFVICPWIPGPIKYHSRASTPDHKYRPQSAYGFSSSYEDYGSHYQKCKIGCYN